MSIRKKSAEQEIKGTGQKLKGVGHASNLDVSGLDVAGDQNVGRRPWPSYGVIAITLTGLPEPFTIFSGAAITTAPVGGS